MDYKDCTDYTGYMDYLNYMDYMYYTEYKNYLDNMDYMDCGLYGFLLLRFLEKESAQRAAARNPKGINRAAAAGAASMGPIRCSLWVLRILRR